MATSVRFRGALALLAVLFAFPRLSTAATVTVPGNYPTIQAAIDGVPDGSTINVLPGTYAEAISVGSGKSLTIRGTGGAAATIVDAIGKGAAAVSVVQAGTVIIDGLTFRRGAPGPSSSGGGFYINQSSPSFVNCVFELNVAFNGGGGAIIGASSSPAFTGCTIRTNSATHFGGGVFIYFGSHPVFTNCNITGNTSGTGTSDGAGGGVGVFDASPTFRGSHINGNTSKFAGGGIFLEGYYNEQVANSGRAMLLVEDTEVADNVSIPTGNPSEGGGIHAEDNATATLTRVRILRNTAGTGGGLNAYRARYDIVDSVIDANKATAVGGFGAGIGTQSNFASATIPASIINLTGTLVRNNEALAPSGVGGGIVLQGDNFSSIKETLTLTTSVVDSNRSTIQGGGVHATRASLTVTNSLIIRNTTGSIGGGVLLLGATTATITGTTIAHNTASQFGGGIYIGGSTISVSSSNVYENTASIRGGGIFVPGPGPTGAVQTSTIADNAPSQISEDSCSAVTYPGNTITPKSGTTQYGTGCGAAIASRAPGANTNAPRFAHFLAVPGNAASGLATTLAWSVARATSVTVAGVGVFTSPTNSPTGTTDVIATASTTYSLTATATAPNGGNYSTPVVASIVVIPPATSPGQHIRGDFDGDGKAEIGVFRPSTGTWYLRYTGTPTAFDIVWGGGSDKIVSADYDGDGKTDIAVFRPSTGTWYIRYTGTPTAFDIVWGGGTDVPVAADYDGDGKTDIAVFRKSTGTWYIRYTGTPTAFDIVWGGGSDMPVPADYDGDGKTDIAVFRPSTGTWYIRYTGTPTAFDIVWGGGTDIPTLKRP